MEKNKLSILLVEDNPADVLFLREALAQDALADFELTVVESLTSAREALPKQTFHASLLDLGLPDSNGLDTFLKLHLSAPELPVVVLSALDDEEVAMQSMQAGAQDYLVKRPQDFPSAGRALRYAIERNQTEKKLRESEKLFVTMFHSNPMPTGITQVDDYRIIDVNKAWTKLTGYTREEAVGHTSIELGLARPETLQRVRGILDVQTTISENEILLYTRAGQERQMLISTETIQLGGEKYFLTNLQDITERKQNEKLIRQWADAFENCAHGIAIGLPATNQVLTCNPTFAQLQGRTVAEISSMPILSMYAPEDHEHVIKNIMEADLKGSVRYEAHMVRKDGTRYPVQMDVISVRDETGNILYRVATQQDITERKQAERELRESEQRFAKLFSSNPSAVVVVTMDGRYVDVNQAYLDLVGMTREDLLGHPDVAAEALRNEEWLMFADLSRTYGGGLRNKEMWLPVRDGHRHVLVSMETIIIGHMPHRMIAINDITELKQTEEALKAEQLRFSQVAATVPGVITALCVQPDVQVNLLYASLAFEDVFGLGITDLNSNTLAIIQRIAPEEVQKILAQLTELAATLEPVYFEFRYQHPLKGEIWLENRAQPVREADGSVIWYGVTSDITERKQAEQKLHESERRYRELFENTNSGVAVYQVVDEGRDFIFKDFNRAGEKIDNDRRERLIGRSILEMRPGVKEFGLLEAMRQVWQTGQAVFLPATHYKDDHLDAWYENFIYCISPDEIATVFENITERKEVEEKLRSSENKYHQLFEAAPIGIILANLHGEILEVNPAVVQILGSPSAEATKAINMLTFPLLIEAGISADFKKTIDLQQTHANEYPYITKWGKSIHIFARFTPLLDTHGTLDRVQILFEDITERKQAESQSEAALEKLRESEERLGLVMEGSQLGYWDWDIETGKVYRNARWAEMLGYTLEEVEFSVKQWSDLHHLDDHESAMKSIQDHLDGKTPAHRIEYRMRAKDGSYKWILDQARVVKRDANGKPLRMSGTHTDITERKQQELQQADEQKILEMLVKGEALSTILEALTGHIESQFPNISYSILLLDSDGLHMHQMAGQNIPQSYVAAIDGLQIGPAAGSCGTAAYRKTPVYVADIASDPLWINYREIALKHGFRACWSMPILATNSTVLGTFAIYSQEPRTPSNIETSLLTTAARLASIAIERKQSEESLHESERRYTTLFQKSGVPVILLKLPEVTMVDVNEAAEELTGYGREELLGKTTVELGIINEQQRNQSIARFEAEGTLAQNEMRIFTKAGQERILIIDTHPIEINKQPFAFVAMQDVTRQKRAEESLKQRLEDLALINTLNEAVNHGEDISRVTQLIASETKKIFGSDYASVYLINPERTLVSLQHFTMTGDPIEKLEKLIGRPLPQIDLPLGGDDHFNQVLRSDHGILFTGFDAINRWLTDFANTTFLSSKVRSLMRKLIPVAAKQLNIHSVISIPLKAGEEALGLIEFASEGTFDESVLERLQNIRHQLAEVILRKRTEQSLRESEEKYRLLAEELEERVKQRTAEVQDLYDNAPAGYHSLDANGCFIRINKTELTWLGYSLEEVIGRPFADFVTPAGLATFKKNFAAFKQRGLLNELEMEFRRKDGTVFQTLVNATAIKDENGNYITSRSTVFDITDRKQAEETIKASETKYRQLFENMTEGFSLNEIITDENEQPVNFRILDANEAYGRHNGLQTRDVIGKTILEIIPAADLRQIETCGKVAQTGEPLEYEYYSQALNRHFSVRAFSPRRGQFATLFEDITVRKLAEDALRKNRDRLDLANKQLERAMKVKDEFLANMSHELRTPLNGILGMSEILLEGIRGPLNERQQTMVKIIEDSGRHLLSLINDILDLSKIEAEKFDLIMENVAVEDICQICLSFIKEPAMKKGVAVNYHPDPAITFLQADPKRLKQILVNLLSNAVKFTLPEGKVSLTVTADVEKNSCRFLVSDTGIGIAPEDMHKLFQPFSQIDSSLTRHYEGSGLGLSLVKRLTELHGGVVSVTSEVGRGSHFVVTLPWKPDPVHTSPSTQVVADTPPVNTVEGRKNLILVAEDNEANNMIFDDYLTSKGYEVISARDGREALEKALAASPDLILMDVQMPEIDGLEVIRRLRATPQFSTTPIIAVTAHAMAGDDEKCLEAGATAYMSKPVKLEEMVNRIKKYLRL